MQERQKRLLGEIISNSPGYTIAQMASFLQASEKTVRSDIKTLNAYLKPYGTYIQQNGKRFFISLHHKQLAIDAYTEISKQDYQQQLLTTPEDRKTKLLFYLLDHPQFHSMEALADETYVSKATIFFHIHELESFLYDYPDIQIEITTHKGIRLLGLEQAKRNLIIQIFHQRISRSISNKFMHAYLLPDIYMEIPHFANILNHCIEEEQQNYAFDEYYRLVSALLISLHRSQSGFPYAESNQIISPFLQTLQHCLQEQLQITLSNEECSYLSIYEKNNKQLSFPQEQTNQEQSISSFLEMIQKQYHIKELPKQPLLKSLLQYQSITNVAAFLNEEDIYQFQKQYLCAFDMTKYLSILLGKTSISVAERVYFAMCLESCLAQTSILKKRILIYESNLTIGELLRANVIYRFGQQADVFICSGSLYDANAMIREKSIDFLLITKSIVSNFSEIPVLKISRLFHDEDAFTILKYLMHTNKAKPYQECNDITIKQEKANLSISIMEQKYNIPTHTILTHKNICFVAQRTSDRDCLFTSHELNENQTLYLFFYSESLSFSMLYQYFYTIAQMLFLD